MLVFHFQETKTPGLRPMEPRDVPGVLRLLNTVST